MLSVNIDQIKSDLNINNIEEVEGFPKYFEIETVNACNARCIMCTVQERNLAKSDEYIMSMELFGEFVQEVSQYSDWIETVCLNRDGEPTLDKYLVQRVKMLKDAGIKKVTFSTNAQNLSNKLIENLLEAGLDDIMISIDGQSKEVFEKIRKKLDFETVKNNTLNFIKIRNQLKYKCSIRIRAVKMKENQHELDECLVFWNEKLSDIDRAYIMPMHSWGNQSYVEQEAKVNYYSNRACISPFSTMIVHVDGTVPLCGCDYNVKHFLGKFPKNSIKVMKSKYLVLGSSGFIGSYIFNELSSISETVGTYSVCSENKNLIKFNIQKDNIQKIIDEYFDNVEKKIAVITIAISKIDQCLRDEQYSYDINVIKMKELISALFKNNFKVIFLSTDNVFSGKKGSYTEKMIPNPINNYGKQKVEIEQFIVNKIPNGLVLRLSQTVGVKPTESHIFKDWINSIKEKKDIICINGQKFTPTLVDNVATGVRLSIEKNLTGIYNLVANESFSREELLKKFIEILDIKDVPNYYLKELSFFNFLDHRALNTSMDNSKILKDLDINFTSMNDILLQLKAELS